MLNYLDKYIKFDTGRTNGQSVEPTHWNKCASYYERRDIINVIVFQSKSQTQLPEIILIRHNILEAKF